MALGQVGGLRIAAHKPRDLRVQPIQNGRRPWWCQRCAGLTCKACGAPIKHPMGADILDDDGTISHFAIFPIPPGCTNPECDAWRG